MDGNGVKYQHFIIVLIMGHQPKPQHPAVNQCRITLKIIIGFEVFGSIDPDSLILEDNGSGSDDSDLYGSPLKVNTYSYFVS